MALLEGNTMKIIQFDEVLEILSFEQAIQTMKACFFDYQKGLITQSPRKVEVLPDGANQNIFAMMPAYLGKDRVFGAKMITAFPENTRYQLPSHLGEILLFDSRTGQPQALIDANAVTWIRTAAVSALATDYLAKKSAEKLVLIGAGQQAVSHFEAINCVRKLKTVFIYDINQENAQKLAERLGKNYPFITFIVCESVKEAVAHAEIICTLTPSREAFLEKEWIQPGTHINAIGTFTPDTREITTDLMSCSTVYVDDYEAALNESGDLLIPMREGALTEDHIRGSLGELVAKKVSNLSSSGRKNLEEITLFDAVGLAVEDLCCAEFIWHKVKGREEK